MSTPTSVSGFAQPGTIHYYVERGDLARVIQLLHADPKLMEQRQTFLGTPLAVAARAGRLDMVRFLLARGASVHSRCSDVYDSQTVLMAACTGNDYPEPARLNIARTLADAGALIRIVDRSGYTALHTACYWGHADVVNLLIARGADIMAFDQDGRTPFTEALRGSALWDDWRLLRFIRIPIDQGANVNARTSNGDTMLHLAAKAGKINSASYLLLKGADVTALDHSGRTPLAVALQHKNDAMAALLRQNGAKG